MAHRYRITGAILAGGESVRMGSPKQDLVLADGRAMIEHVARALDAVCDDIVILGTCEALPALRRITDLRAACGPLGGVEALLASGIAPRYIICPCDLPSIGPDPLRALIDAPDAVAAVLRLDGSATHEPLPARVDAAALPVVQRLLDEGRRSMRGLMQALAPCEVAAPAAWRANLHNVNSPDDAARA